VVVVVVALPADSSTKTVVKLAEMRIAQRRQALAVGLMLTGMMAGWELAKQTNTRQTPVASSLQQPQPTPEPSRVVDEHFQIRVHNVLFKQPLVKLLADELNRTGKLGTAPMLAAAHVITNNTIAAQHATMKVALGTRGNVKLPKVSNVRILPKVTISVVTCSLRQHWHPLLRRTIDGQDYKGEMETIMLDSPCGKTSRNFGIQREPGPNAAMGPNTSSFKYIWYSENSLHTGTKRNRLRQMATGDIIVHIDDDDYYGPSYISTVVKRLVSHPEAYFTKMHAFYALSENYETSRTGRCKFKNKDTCIIRKPLFLWRNFMLSNPRGYGFCYAYWKNKLAHLQFKGELFS
jgi:hypothetical protein